MALILDEARASTAALSRAPFSRQWDVYRLANLGDAGSRQLWDDFREQDPGSARLVVEHDQAERASAELSTRHVNKVLAAGLPLAASHGSKAARKAAKAAARKAAQSTPVDHGSVPAGSPFVPSIYDPDPAQRELAWRLRTEGAHRG